MLTDPNELAILATTVIGGVLLLTFWPRPKAKRTWHAAELAQAIAAQAPIAKPSREEYILAETVLDDVTCEQYGPFLTVTGSYLHNGYVRRRINVQVRGLEHHPIHRNHTQYIFNRQEIINEINKAIKEAPQWNY